MSAFSSFTWAEGRMIRMEHQHGDGHSVCVFIPKEGRGRFSLNLEKALTERLKYGGGLLGYFLLQYRCQSEYLHGRCLPCTCLRWHFLIALKCMFRQLRDGDENGREGGRQRGCGVHQCLSDSIKADGWCHPLKASPSFCFLLYILTHKVTFEPDTFRSQLVLLWIYMNGNY